MAKGNNKRGNKEVKKPKQENQKASRDGGFERAGSPRSWWPARRSSSPRSGLRSALPMRYRPHPETKCPSDPVSFQRAVRRVQRLCFLGSYRRETKRNGLISQFSHWESVALRPPASGYLRRGEDASESVA